MPFKVVTGNPGAGKSYYVMREVICKRFIWDTEFHEWKRKTDDPFTIFTNMEGLRLPHVNLPKYFKENNIEFRQFFTTKYIRELTEKIGPIVIVLDEAQKYFPKTFKDSKDIERNQDAENSCFYFFEFHRHLQVELYLLGQRWTRMHPDIVGVCDYQIDAVNRVFKLGNEFRYNFMNGFERIGGTILRSDPKVFALYQSFEAESEIKGKTVNPVRRFVLLVALGLVALLLAFKMFFASFSPSEASEKTRPTGAGAVSTSRIPEDGDAAEHEKKPVGAGGGQTVPVLSVPDDPQVTRIRLGGMWIGQKLIAIDLFGNVLPAREFPFAYTHNKDEGAVFVMLPDSYLAKVKRDIDTAHEYRIEASQRAAQVKRVSVDDPGLAEYIQGKALRDAKFISDAS